MLKSEKETVINWDEVDDTCHISTYSPSIISKLRGYGVEPQYVNNDGSCYFTIDKNWISVRRPSKKPWVKPPPPPRKRGGDIA